MSAGLITTLGQLDAAADAEEEEEDDEEEDEEDDDDLGDGAGDAEGLPIFFVGALNAPGAGRESLIPTLVPFLKGPKCVAAPSGGTDSPSLFTQCCCPKSRLSSSWTGFCFAMPNVNDPYKASIMEKSPKNEGPS
jgi:hypothetical protein